MAALQPLAETGGQAEPPAQSTEAPLTSDQLMAAARRYFRDTAEFPLLQKMEFSVFDPAGHIRKAERISVDYVFQGYSPHKHTATGKVNGKVSMWQALRGARTFKASLNGVLWTLDAGGILFGDLTAYTFEAAEARDGEALMLAKLIPKQACPPLAMTTHPEEYIPDSACGTKEYHLSRDLHFRKFAYEASGLPATVRLDPFGKCTLERYHTEVEFQAVTIPEEKEPFLIPKRVATRLETSKGSIFITSLYEPKRSATISTAGPGK